LLTCYRYIELNAVRAKRVEKPDEYRWSSYRANAYGVNNPIITPLRSCMALRKGRKQRAKYYRESFKEVLGTESSSMKSGPQSRQERHWEMSGSKQR
jgi:putative transposase